MRRYFDGFCQSSKCPSNNKPKYHRRHQQQPYTLNTFECWFENFKWISSYIYRQLDDGTFYMQLHITLESEMLSKCLRTFSLCTMAFSKHDRALKPCEYQKAILRVAWSSRVTIKNGKWYGETSYVRIPPPHTHGPHFDRGEGAKCWSTNSNTRRDSDVLFCSRFWINGMAL